VLKKGDKGPYVFALQKRLGIRADGLFDEDTDAEVRLFQRKLGFTADGVVRRAMWYALGMMAAGEGTLTADVQIISADRPPAPGTAAADPLEPPSAAELADEAARLSGATLLEREPLKWPTHAYLGRLFLFYGLVAVASGLLALFVITAIARPELALVIVVVAFLFVPLLFTHRYSIGRPRDGLRKSAAPEQFTPAELMHKLSRGILGLLRHPA
jgi:Putative peptidoglycan binding domain